MKRPASQFYWGDWLNCKELRVCSVAARGLWMDMLAYMRQGKPMGYLTHENGQPITAPQLARLVGESLPVVNKLLAELEAAGVGGKTDQGAYFSRRMVRDEATYQEYRAGQAEAGARGAAARWGKQAAPQNITKGANGVAHSDPTQGPKGEHGSSFSPTDTNSKEKKEHAPALRAGFDRFWAAYPNRVEQDEAWRVWQKRKPDGSLTTTILDAIERQKRSSKWTAGYIPNPAKWLKNGRWKDEPVEIPAPPPSPRSGRTGAGRADKYAGVMRRPPEVH